MIIDEKKDTAKRHQMMPEKKDAESNMLHRRLVSQV